MHWVGERFAVSTYFLRIACIEVNEKKIKITPSTVCRCSLRLKLSRMFLCSLKTMKKRKLFELIITLTEFNMKHYCYEEVKHALP